MLAPYLESMQVYKRQQWTQNDLSFSISIDLFDLFILGVGNNEFKTYFSNLHFLHISIDIKVRLRWSGHLKENLTR